LLETLGARALGCGYPLHLKTELPNFPGAAACERGQWVYMGYVDKVRDPLAWARWETRIRDSALLCSWAV
jgi:hypothetical protein